MKMSENPYKLTYHFDTALTPETFPLNESSIKRGCYDLTYLCHGMAVTSGWHHDIHTGKPIDRNTGELICLMHSELSEAMEADRKGLMDDKLPNRLGIEVELADAVIRIFDFAGVNGLDLGGAIVEKVRFNSQRADHKPENRRLAGGKAY